MKLKSTSSSIKQSKEELNIFLVFEKPTKTKKLNSAQLISSGFKSGSEEKELATYLKQWADRGIFSGRTDSVHSARLQSGKDVLLVGVGPEDQTNLESFRRAGARAFQYLKSEGYEKAAIDTFSFGKKVEKSEDRIKAFSEGLLLSNYNWDRYKSEKAPGLRLKEVVFYLTRAGEDKAAKEAFKWAEAVAEGTNVTRDFSNDPPSHLTPANWAKECQKLGQKYAGLSVKVLNQAQIKREKMGALLGVNQGSYNEARVVVLTLNPKASGAGKKSSKPVGLVGKGLTFDSGGVSLKPAGSMQDMKHDKTGGATVIGTMVALAKLGVKKKVIAVVGMTDNMPDGNAIVPSTVLKSRSGKTIEVHNTDAEGRLVLADCLDYIQDSKPGVVVDMATLTGAVVIALDNIAAGVMGNDEKSIEALKKASEDTGERVWQLPLYPEFRENMSSDTADICNIGKTRGAGSSKAGCFLQEFIRENQKWVHVDIAGVGWDQSHLPYAPPKGASGAMTRAMTQFVLDYT